MTSPFDGSWQIDLSQSAVWDVQTGCHVPDEVGQELITIRTENSVQDYEVLLGDRPTIRMGYTSRFDAVDWVPYTVREIRGVDPVDEAAAVAAFVDRIRSRVKDFRVGAAYGLVRTVYVDERTHYRVSRSEAGNAEYIMQRRLADDGQSYLSTVLRTDGIVSIVRRFVRAA